MASKLIASELAKLDKLNGLNNMSHRKIRCDLIHDNVDSALEETAPTLGDNPSKSEKRAYEQRLQNDKKAKSHMLMFMEDNLIKIFKNYKIVRDLWLAIKDKYGTTSEINIQLLLHKYNTCEIKEGESVIEHVNKMIFMAKNLATTET